MTLPLRDPPPLPRVDEAALAPYGWGPAFREALSAYSALSAPGGGGDEVGRISAEHQGAFLVRLAEGELPAKVPGRLRRAIAHGDADRPTVGDWVVVDRPGGSARIRAVLPRRTRIARKVAGDQLALQVLAANVDVALLVSSLDRDLSPRRLERYLALALDGGVAPVVLLTKADLCPDPGPAIAAVRAVAPDAPIHLLSSLTGEGLDAIDPYCADARTAVLLGSSGVGKSTLLNRLLGADVQVTGELGADGKGRHTTTHRQLFRTPSGGLLIDTPGMRELGLWEAGAGVRGAFADIEEIAGSCRFRDCRHEGEPGCAVAGAVASGALDPVRLQSFQNLQGEAEGAARRRSERVGGKALQTASRPKGR